MKKLILKRRNAQLILAAGIPAISLNANTVIALSYPTFVLYICDTTSQITNANKAAAAANGN